MTLCDCCIAPKDCLSLGVCLRSPPPPPDTEGDGLARKAKPRFLTKHMYDGLGLGPQVPVADWIGVKPHGR